MNIARIALASLGGFVAYFVIGGLAFVLIPSLKTEFLKYPAVYRGHEGQMSNMPLGMIAIYLATLVLAVMYAMLDGGGSGVVEGARFGALIGAFVIFAFVIHNYVNLNIGWKLTLEQAIAYFIEWLVVGIVIGLIYRPTTIH
ncbi:MAG TPA: DUF1761 domain-containing protein [Candidatus Acidoferrales bacterium]